MISNTSPMVLKVIEQAKLNLKEQDMLLPTWFLGNDEGMAIVGTPFDGPDVGRAKDMAAWAVRKIAKESGATFALFVSESYTILDQDAAKDYMNNRDKYPEGIKDHPKAVEVVLFQLETEEMIYIGMAPILKDREMGEVDWKSTLKESMEGRFTNMIQSTKKPTAH